MSENAQARWHLTEGDTIEHSSLAQSVEHLTVNQVVAGSSPAGGANKRKVRICVPFLLFTFLTDLNRDFHVRWAEARSVTDAMFGVFACEMLAKASKTNSPFRRATRGKCVDPGCRWFDAQTPASLPGEPTESESSLDGSFFVYCI